MEILHGNAGSHAELRVLFSCSVPVPHDQVNKLSGLRLSHSATVIEQIPGGPRDRLLSLLPFVLD